MLDNTRVIQDCFGEATRYDTYNKKINYVVCEMMNVSQNIPEQSLHMSQKYVCDQTTYLIRDCKSLTERWLLWDVTPKNDERGADQPLKKS